MVIMRSRLTLVSFIIVFKSSTDNAPPWCRHGAGVVASGRGGCAAPTAPPGCISARLLTRFLLFIVKTFWSGFLTPFGPELCLSLWSFLPKSIHLDSWSNCLPSWPPDLACLFLWLGIPPHTRHLPTRWLSAFFGSSSFAFDDFSEHEQTPAWPRGPSELSFLSGWTPV